MNVPFGNKGIPDDPEPEWWQDGLEDPYALQYAKIGDNWGSSKCNGAYVPMKPLDTTDPRRKYCVNVNDPAYCKNEKIDNAKKVLPGVFGTCGASECISGYVPYDGKCAKKPPDNRRLLVKDTSRNYNDKIGGQPGVAMIPVDEIQPDYSCTQMCTNTGVSKSGKSFRSLLPSKWPGSYIFSTNPTSRFWNHSIDEIATDVSLWDKNIANTFKKWHEDNGPSNKQFSPVQQAKYWGGLDAKYKIVADDVRTKGIKRYAVVHAFEPNEGEWPGHYLGKNDDEKGYLKSWKEDLLKKSQCYCQGTSKPEHAW